MAARRRVTETEKLVRRRKRKPRRWLYVLLAALLAGGLSAAVAFGLLGGTLQNWQARTTQQALDQSLAATSAAIDRYRQAHPLKPSEQQAEKLTPKS